MDRDASRFLDELARLMTDAAGAAQGVKREVDAAFRFQLERFMADMELVRREEFDAVREMAANARAKCDELAERIEALEKAKTDSAKPKAKAEAKHSGKLGTEAKTAAGKSRGKS